MTTYETQSEKLGITSSGKFGNNECAVAGGPAMPAYFDGKFRLKAFAAEFEPVTHYIDVDRVELVVRVEVDGLMTAEHDISVEDQVALLTGHYNHLRP